jgi:hypothetical protein
MNKHFFRALLRDTGNRIRYGKEAPCYGERIYVTANACENILPTQGLYRGLGLRLRQSSGRVITCWPDAEVVELANHPKLTYCFKHWQLAETWEQAGAYAYMLHRIQQAPGGHFDGCSTFEDVRARFVRLDGIFSALANGSPYKTVAELDNTAFREVSGVIVHIDPEGQPVFGGGGAHRFAIARALGLRIPAQLGVVHRAGLPFLPAFRQPV